jgi:hypothetical protein
MDAAIAELQKPFLDESQIASSRAIMGLDTQLIDDGTYFLWKKTGRLQVVADGAAEPPCMAETRPPGAALPCLILPNPAHVQGLVTGARSPFAGLRANSRPILQVGRSFRLISDE